MEEKRKDDDRLGWHSLVVERSSAQLTTRLAAAAQVEVRKNT
jgi:hypothetical protein